MVSRKTAVFEEPALVFACVPVFSFPGTTRPARAVLTGELLLELPHQGSRLLLLLRLLQALPGKLQSDRRKRESARGAHQDRDGLPGPDSLQLLRDKGAGQHVFTDFHLHPGVHLVAI